MADMSDDDKSLIYDLRQIYANIVGEVLKRITYWREQDEYAQYYKALNDLRLEIMKNLKEKEREELRIAREKTLRVLEEHEQVLTKQNNDPLERHHVEEALGDYEILLKDLMEKHDMYGAKYDDSGL